MYQEDKNELRKWQIWLPTMVALALVFGIFAGLKLQENQPALVIEHVQDSEGPQLGYGRMEELVRYIDAKYVDKVDGQDLVHKAIKNLLKELDPHSTFISKEELKEVNDQLRGNFDGIGIEFMLLDDTIVVISALSGGPSESAGIITGDKIIQVEDSIIAGKQMSSEDIVQFLRGDKGTKVNLGIQRHGEPGLLHVEVVRDKIPTKSIETAFMLDSKTGFIKINRFSATTYEDFMKSLENLVEGGLQNLVIDLRQNPGGYLQEATNMLSQLISERGHLLVYTEGEHVRKTEYESTGRNFFDIDKLAILIDEGSASASEIIAGAIQDWDRGVIIGRRSFGKGLVQEQYKLSDGSALRLTVARYYTPSGRCIQREYADNEIYEDDFHQRLISGELVDSDKFHFSDTTQYFTSGGRIVYGGGGIQPDIFVPLDTMTFREPYLMLRQEIPAFAFRYFETHQDELRRYGLEDFKQGLPGEENIFKDFMAFVSEKNVSYNPKNLARMKPLLIQFIYSRLAKHALGEDAFFPVYLEGDPFILEALKAFRHSNPIVEMN